MKRVMDFTLSFLCFITLSISSAKANDSGDLVCYMELWAHTRNTPNNYDVDALPDNKCDYLVLFSLTLEASTYEIKLHDGYFEVEPDDLETAAASKSRNPNMKVLLAVGGWPDGVAAYSEMLSEKSRRSAFIRSAVKMLETYNLDGLELHWLYPGTVWRGGKAGDKANFVKLVMELAQEFKPRKWILTAGVPADEPSINQGFNVGRLNSLLHRFHVRTFDLRGDWSKVADNHSPLYGRYDEKPELKRLNVNDTISLWLRKGASPSKVVPIFPLFGRSFKLRSRDQSKPGSDIVGPGSQAPFTQAPGILAYFEICVGIQNGDLKREFDHDSQTPYALSQTDWVGYDDEQSLEKKAKFVLKHNLAGAALFAVSMDDFTSACGSKHFLVNKMSEFLHRDDY